MVLILLQIQHLSILSDDDDAIDVTNCTEIMKMTAMLCPLLPILLVIAMIMPITNGFSVAATTRRKKLALVTGEQAIQVGYVL